MADIDAIIIGAGVVGLAIARSLAISGKSVIILEKNSAFGEETSSRNSEVIHAGMYYPTNSLKAKLCVRGNQLIYEYCAPRGINADRMSKLIVCTNNEDLSGLETIYKRGLANGVQGLEIIDGAKIKAIEPAINAIAAIYSPNSGHVDSHSMMLAFLGDIEDNGGALARNSPFLGAIRKNNEWEVSVGGESPTKITSNSLILSAGLWSEQVANLVEGLDKSLIPHIKYGKGNYFHYAGKVPFSRLIYPMPSKTALGIHLTPETNGQARLGPDLEEVSNLDYNVDIQRQDLFYASLKSYWPDAKKELLTPDYTGIRPKIGDSLHDFEDFRIIDKSQHNLDGLICLFGIDSPGLTSSMALGEEVSARLQELGR